MKNPKVSKFSIGIYVDKKSDMISYKIVGTNEKGEIVFTESSKGKYNSTDEALNAGKIRVEYLAGLKMNLKKIL